MSVLELCCSLISFLQGYTLKSLGHIVCISVHIYLPCSVLLLDLLEVFMCLLLHMKQASLKTEREKEKYFHFPLSKYAIKTHFCFSNNIDVPNFIIISKFNHWSLLKVEIIRSMLKVKRKIVTKKW